VIGGLLVIGAFVSVLILVSRLHETRCQRDQAARERDAAIAASHELLLLLATALAITREEETRDH
jgi:hypothetical protein